MMETTKEIQTENMELLMEIVTVKNDLKKLNSQTGPNSSDYINLTLQLNSLVNEYIEDRIEKLTK